MVWGQLDIPSQKSESKHRSLTKTNSKWITDLNMKFKSKKFQENNIRDNIVIGTVMTF